jgi:Glyoxalase/Bleomycin resistance protein/Dioxygenase superfamily
MHLNGFFQNAYVTRSLEHAVAAVTGQHGIRDWVYFSPEMEVYTATHGYGPCHVKVALGWADALQIELIEPVWGNLHHYLEYLPADQTDYSPRLHHVCMRVLDWEKARAEVDAKQWPVAYEGGVEGCKFVYIDARASLGHYLEYMWMSPELWTASGGKETP